MIFLLFHDVGVIFWDVEKGTWKILPLVKREGEVLHFREATLLVRRTTDLQNRTSKSTASQCQNTRNHVRNQEDCWKQILGWNRKPECFGSMLKDPIFRKIYLSLWIFEDSSRVNVKITGGIHGGHQRRYIHQDQKIVHVSSEKTYVVWVIKGLMLRIYVGSVISHYI